jgi:3-phosphoshikimate 1-carboxyvinyltransferase
VTLDVTTTGDGVTVAVEGGQPVRAIDDRVPGDISAAAFWLVAGAIHPDAELTVEAVGVKIDLLARMGADITERPIEAGAGDDVGEPLADLTVRSAGLSGIDIEPREVAAAIDEIPVLCLAAAVADGPTRIRGAGELRHKESDRISGMAAGLAALGARMTVDGDDLTIDGGAGLAGGGTDSVADHRLAMAFAIAGLVARGETTIRGADSASISYPGFFDDLERIRA